MEGNESQVRKIVVPVDYMRGLGKVFVQLDLVATSLPHLRSQ